MQTKFKRQQKVIILITPDPEYIEYHTENLENPDNLPVIKKGMKGEINIILPNGTYHVELFDEEGNSVAYAPFGEDSLEAVE